MVDRFGFFPELDYDKSGYTLTLDNTIRAVGENLAYLVTVTHPDGIKVKSYFDYKTGLKVKQITEVPNASANEFSDYREVNGVKVPYNTKTVLLGVPVEFKVSNVLVNTGLTNEEFK